MQDVLDDEDDDLFRRNDHEMPMWRLFVVGMVASIGLGLIVGLVFRALG